MAAGPNSETGVRVLNERGISTTEMEQQLHDFLRKPYVKEGLSSEDYTRLQALKRALKQESQEGVDKLIKLGHVTSEWICIYCTKLINESCLSSRSPWCCNEITSNDNGTVCSCLSYTLESILSLLKTLTNVSTCWAPENWCLMCGLSFRENSKWGTEVIPGQTQTTALENLKKYKHWTQLLSMQLQYWSTKSQVKNVICLDIKWMTAGMVHSPKNSSFSPRSWLVAELQTKDHLECVQKLIWV